MLIAERKQIMTHVFVSLSNSVRGRITSGILYTVDGDMGA